MHRTANAQPAIDGTCALSTYERRLVLLEGGRKAPVQPRRQDLAPRPGMLSARQSALLEAVAAIALAVIVLLSLGTDLVRTSQASSALESASTSTVVVEEGDTLWGIAERSDAKGCTTSDVVSWIKDKNALDNGTLTPGQRLIVPDFTL